MLAIIRSLLSRESGQAELAVQRYPTLSSPEWDSRHRGDRLQRAVILQMRLKQTKPIKGELSSVFWEPRQLVHP